MVNLLSRFQQVRHQVLYLSLLFSISIILFTVISCNADISSILIGKWEYLGQEHDGKLFRKSNPSWGAEFFSDKTLDYNGDNCNWTILEDGRIKITSSVMGFGRVFYGLLQGDILKIEFNYYRKKK